MYICQLFNFCKKNSVRELIKKYLSKQQFKKLTSGQLFKDTFIYTVGAFLQRGITFALIPIYLNVLSVAEFGNLDLINTLIYILSILFSCGLNQYYYAEYYTSKETKKDLISQVSSSFLLFNILIGVFLIPSFLIFGKHILNIPNQNTTIILAYGISILMFAQSLYFLNLRLAFKSIRFISISILSSLIIASMNIYMVYYLRKGITAILFTNLVSISVVSMIGFYDFYKRFKFPKIDFSKAKYFIRNSSPFILTSLFAWIANYADRWIIKTMLDDTKLGIYSAAFKFSQIYDPLIIAPFLSAFTPYLFKRLSEKNYKTKFSTIVPIILIAFAAFAFVSIGILYFFAKEKYAESLQYIPFMVMGFAFYFIAQLVGGIMLFYKKKRALALNIALSGIVNLSLNFILIKTLGLKGSAIAFLSSNLFWCLLTVYQSVNLLNKMKREVNNS